MPGVNGATKLNKIVAPSVKTTETENSVSGFELKSSKQLKEERVTKTVEIEADNLKVVQEKEIEVIVEQPKYNKGDIKTHFNNAVNIIKKLYDKVFSKSPSFKPTFDETVGDLILYLSAKLNRDGVDEIFNMEFGVKSENVFEKYKQNYVPYALKLSSWCEQKGLVFVREDLLYEISALYVVCLGLCGIDAKESLIIDKFATEITFVNDKK